MLCIFLVSSWGVQTLEVLFIKSLSPISFHSSLISLKISHLSLLSKSDCHGPAQCSQLPLKGPTINNLCH